LDGIRIIVNEIGSPERTDPPALTAVSKKDHGPRDRMPTPAAVLYGFL